MKAETIAAWTLDPGGAIVPQVYALLREAIIRAELAPGDRISESEIAQACRVSRQPVREAFIRLAGGRCDPEPGTVQVGGDQALGQRVLDALATTP